MCGIFGFVSSKPCNLARDLSILAKESDWRGKDSSGYITHNNHQYEAYYSDVKVSSLLKQNAAPKTTLFLGHSRLATNDDTAVQPVIAYGLAVAHNGIVLNSDSILRDAEHPLSGGLDTLAINYIASNYLLKNESHTDLFTYLTGKCEGVLSVAILDPAHGKLILLSNNGSLYYGIKGDVTYFSSEAHPLRKIGIKSAIRLLNKLAVFDVPVSASAPVTHRCHLQDTTKLLPALEPITSDDRLLKYSFYNSRRCTRCILPQTMPFISFDSDGICNYCRNYKTKNIPQSFQEFTKAIDLQKSLYGDKCIIPFSGGRDSSFALHVATKELGLKCYTYTYDWGMITDLARRNISRMCSRLGVENIIVAADIRYKRRNIAMNLAAWLAKPKLGMLSLLTAGDKHFFQHINRVKELSGISLNIWGINPLEVTHFKSGFLGIPPSFQDSRVYKSGLASQLRYQGRRIIEICDNPKYLNSSLPDTLTGEYWRSIAPKKDYYQLFDYIRWDEASVEHALSEYEWERSPDSRSTWRIGDGTAAFYNYVYCTVAGFTEHDTFRSNQIREGQLTREKALELVLEENQPRYPNIKWYLDSLGFDFQSVITSVNAIPRLY